MANATLAAIQKKVRRLTMSPSVELLSDADLNEYINTAILYDFPQHLKLFPLRKTLTFYTQPGVDVYETEDTDTTNPLYNFKNRYITVHPVVYIGGVQSFYTQERDVFYGNFPPTVTTIDTGLRGNGAVGPFVGTLAQRFAVQGSVIFSALDAAGEAMIVVDYPVSNTTGALGLPNQPQTLPSPYGQINYVTGAYTLNFPANTANSVDNIIYSQAQYYIRGMPTAVLFFDQKFTIRPVPDKVYPVQLQVNVRPTELLVSGDSPDLEQWWQYISYLASKKILEDRMDTDSIELIMPELLKQQALVMRTTLEQQANQRTVTIYTQGKNYGWGWNNSGNWPF